MSVRDTPHDIGSELLEHDWFLALDPVHQALLREGASVRYYEAGACIAPRGEPTLHWFGVHTGLIMLAVYDAEGRGATFSGVPAGGWFGEGSVIKRELRRYDVVAVRASSLILVPVDLFHRLLAESLSFNAFVIRSSTSAWGNLSPPSRTSACWPSMRKWRNRSRSYSTPCYIRA